MLSQWRQFTLGSGTHWYFDGQIMERGVGGRGSDMGRLLRNAMGWLATAPGSSVGGFVTPPGRWLSPNQNGPGVAQFPNLTTKTLLLGDHYDPKVLDTLPCAGCSAAEKSGKMFRGTTFQHLSTIFSLFILSR